MQHDNTWSAPQAAWPRWWRMTIVALATLILCSCRTAPPTHMPPGMAAAMAHHGAGPCLDGPSMPPTVAAAIGGPVEDTPLPQMLVTPGRPPGIACPWPADEYIHDGGDRDALVTVASNWQINGLNLEDTIVHYDTLDGQTIVEPSNRVCLYAPRFAAVRRVSTVHENLQKDHVEGVDLPVKVNLHNEKLLATSAVQPVAPIGEIGTKQASISQLNQNPVLAVNQVLLGQVQDGFLPHENFSVIRYGIADMREKARLAESIDAAIVWTHDTALQVVIENTKAVVETGDQKAQVTFRADLPTCPRLRVIKTASRQVAKPGDLVDFTIRFDNIGDATIGNVTLVDNLTTRLEYMPDTAKSSLTADFGTQVNDGDSLILRWEFRDPLKPGDGGLVRFQCKVR